MVLALAIFIAVPVCAELALRAAGTQFEPQLYVADRGLGWKLRAGARGTVSAESKQWVQINSHGFRDRERSYEKPINTVRIAVLGNSWTEALQVPQEKVYAAVLQDDLQQRACFAPKQVEVLNFGVAGYSTAQELLTLQQKVWSYQPDIVLLAFYPARDIANGLRELNNAVNPEQSPYFVYRDGKLVFDDAFRALPSMTAREIFLQGVRYDVTDHVRLLQAVNYVQKMGRIRLAMSEAKARAEKAGVDNLEYAIYAPPADAQIETAWKVTEELLLMIRNEVKEHGAAFRLVILATRPQVIPDLAKRQELMRKLGVTNLSYAENRLRDFAGSQGMAVTDLAPALSQFAETNHVYLNGFNRSNLGSGHWNEAGHRVAAAAMAGDLCGAEAAARNGTRASN